MVDLFTIDRPSRHDNFLSINRTQAYIDTKIPSLEELMRNIINVKEDKILNKRLSKEKDKDKVQRFDRSKVQMDLICDGCNYHQCVYFNKMVGAKGGPTKSYVEELQRWS